MPTMFDQQNHFLRSCGNLQRYEQPVTPTLMLSREEQDNQSELICMNRMTDRVLRCCYCGKVFASPQAFGGHHNKHRKEREVMLKEHEKELMRSIGETKLTLATPSVDRNTLTLLPAGDIINDPTNDTTINNDPSSEVVANAKENKLEIRPKMDINEEPRSGDESMTEPYLDQMEGKIQDTDSNKFDNEVGPSTSLSLANFSVDVTLKL